MLFRWFVLCVVLTIYENHSIGHLQRPSRLRRSLTTSAEFNDNKNEARIDASKGKHRSIVCSCKTSLVALLPKGNDRERDMKPKGNS